MFITQWFLQWHQDIISHVLLVNQQVTDMTYVYCKGPIIRGDLEIGPVLKTTLMTTFAFVAVFIRGKIFSG